MRLTKEKRKELKKLYLEKHPWFESITIGFISKALKDAYGVYHADPKDATKWSLLNKYEEKISERLKVEMRVLRVDGERQASIRMKQFIYSNNPFLAMIPKKEEFYGETFPLPFNLKTTKCRCGC